MSIVLERCAHKGIENQIERGKEEKLEKVNDRNDARNRGCKVR